MLYNFHYELRGNREQPRILFCHGFMGSIQEFDEAISLLCEEFCCLAVDLPGHGKTKVLGGDECYTMPNTAHALKNLLEQLNFEPCFLVGYSMGGRLALYMTLHFPQCFSKVVLESASPGLKTEAEQLKRRQRDWEIAEKLETEDLLTFLSNWYNQPLFSSLKQHPNFEQMINIRQQNNPLELAKSLRHMSTGCQPSLWKSLQDNQVPLLLLVGDYDHKFKSINSEIVTICPEANLNVIANCGHNIHFENVNEFVKNIRQFL